MAMEGYVRSRNPMHEAKLQGLKVPDDGTTQPAITAHIEGDSYPPTTSGNVTENEDTAHDGLFSRATEHQQTQFTYAPRPQHAQYSNHAQHPRQARQTIQHKPVLQSHGTKQAMAKRRENPPIAKTMVNMNQQDYLHASNQLPYARATLDNPTMPAMLNQAPHMYGSDEAEELNYLPKDNHDRDGDVSQQDTLDHDPDMLYTMSFEALKAENFDLDPRNPVPPAGLMKRLRTLSPDDATSQIFADTTAAEWETAGKWILTQLTETTEALVAVRREMRQVSLSHESEVEKEYLEIKAKHDKVDFAMKAMRKQGQALLAMPK